MKIEVFDKQYKKWLSGIYSEVLFWDGFISGEYFRKLGRSELMWNEYISPNRPFTLDEEIPDKFNGKDYKFIDIGCGAYSRCGLVSKKVNLNGVYVDPLAFVYNRLKNMYHTDNGISLTTGFVEMLDDVIQENEFDMVHMSNSLDHCYDPIFAIYQLIRICKIDGKIILRHAENEAERGNYNGLHQWNLSLENKEHSFVIWNKKCRYDICKLFAEYVDFELTAKECEQNGTWIYNKVVMTKKKNIKLPDNPYKTVMKNAIYKFFLSTLLDDVLMGVGNNKDKKLKYYFNVINNMSMDKIKEKLHLHDISSVTIYGMGKLGKLLKDKLDAACIPVIFCIDRNNCIDGYETINIDEYKNQSEKIIITAVEESDVFDIKNNLSNKGIDNFLTIADILGDAKIGKGI